MLRSKRTEAVLNITEYEPLKKAKAILGQAKDKVARLEADLQNAKAEAQSLEEEAIRLATLAEVGEAENKAAAEAEKKTAAAKRTAQELEGALRRAKLELQVKADLVKQKEAEARKAVADNLRNAHKKAVRKLADILAQAVEANLQVKEIQEQWYRLNLNGGKFDGLPGTLPGMHWAELLPEQHAKLGGPKTGGVVAETKYSFWLKELRRYGYAE